MSEKCLFVTGASSDVGIQLLNRIEHGYTLIYAHYNHENARLTELKDKLGERLVLLQADLTDREAVKGMLDAVDERGIYPDHFVHLASDRMVANKFHKCSVDDFNKGWTISLESTIILLRLFLCKMMKKRHGRVVFMLTSCTLNIPPKYQSVYVTTKYALLGLMKSLSTEYASKGITVNGISPDMMDTKFLDGMLKKEIVLEENASRNPLGRNIAISDVIPMFEYLLSDAAEAVTGQNIAITGGIA